MWSSSFLEWQVQIFPFAIFPIWFDISYYTLLCNYYFIALKDKYYYLTFIRNTYSVSVLRQIENWSVFSKTSFFWQICTLFRENKNMEGFIKSTDQTNTYQLPTNLTTQYSYLKDLARYIFYTTETQLGKLFSSIIYLINKNCFYKIERMQRKTS